MNNWRFFSTSVVSNSEFWCLGVHFAEEMEEIKGTGEGRTGPSEGWKRPKRGRGGPREENDE